MVHIILHLRNYKKLNVHHNLLLNLDLPKLIFFAFLAIYETKYRIFFYYLINHHNYILEIFFYPDSICIGHRENVRNGSAAD